MCRIAKHLLPREVVHGAQGASLEQKRVAQLGLIVQLCLQQATDSESGILHNRNVLHATGTRQSTSSNTPMHTDYARHGSSRCVKVTRPLEHRPFPPPKPLSLFQICTIVPYAKALPSRPSQTLLSLTSRSSVFALRQGSQECQRFMLANSSPPRYSSSYAPTCIFSSQD